MEVYGVIYLIINLLNGMKYVGQTTNFKRRISQHKRGIQCVDREIQTYNWENFTVEVLEECQTQEQLNEREKFWIRKLGCIYPNGYNRTSGGSSGWICTSETCLKMGTAKSGEKNPFFGKHHTTKSRAQISLAKSGVPKSIEHVIKFAIAQRIKSSFKNLSNAIIEREFTFASLAKLMGLSRRSISRKICGKVKFLKKDIDKLVEIFGLPAEYLLVRDDGQPTILSKRGETPFKNLSNEMKKMQLSYAALGKLMSLSQSTISEKMQGKTKFSDEDVTKLVEIFGKPAEYLMSRYD